MVEAPSPENRPAPRQLYLGAAIALPIGLLLWAAMIGCILWRV